MITQVDPLTLAVVSNALVATAEEMGWVLRKTSFSEAVREGEDCSASIFDAEANMIAQGNYAPAHLGTSPDAVAAVLDEYPLKEMRPGDAFLLNDPSVNSGHLPDIYSIAPIFFEEQVVGFTVLTAHHVDVGGAAPGSQAIIGISDIHQEGVRILPIRYVQDGEPIREILRLVGANVRVPEQVLGDIKGQNNANRVGGERVAKLIGSVGLEAYKECARQIIKKSEDAMRTAIRRVPDGSYRFVDHFDDYGPGTPPVRVEVTIRVAGDSIVVDYSGSGPTTDSGLNAYLPFTRAYARHTLKSIIAPSVPQNSGAMRPIEVVAPGGCFFNAQYPTPSGGRAICVRLVVDSVLGAMAQALPGQVTAASSQLCNSTIGGIDERTGRPFVYYDLTFGSTGARPSRDGCDGLVSGFNTGNIPVEIHESVWPVRIERFGFVPDTGGAGRFRGGLAVRRDVRSLARRARLTNLHDRHVFPPWGLAEGRAGAVGRIVVNPDTDQERDVHSKSIVELKDGDVISFRTCGSGGWGDPLERDPEAVRSDVLEGWVSSERARALYGVVLLPDGAREVVEPETSQLRTELWRGVVATGEEKGEA